MPHEGYADPIMNDGPSFHLDMPISELAKRDTRGYDHKDEPTLDRTPATCEGSRKVGLTKRHFPREGLRVRARGRRTMAQILGRGYARKQETLSPTSFAILFSIFSDT